MAPVFVAWALPMTLGLACWARSEAAVDTILVRRPLLDHFHQP